MTVPALLVQAGFDHISEREADGSWEDCTWCAGLEWYRLCYDRSRPSTHTEMQALRAASGEPTTGGSNLDDLRRGIKNRYGKTVVLPVSGFTALKAALTPDHAAVVQGSMRVFGSTHRLSVWDRGFDGTHAVLVVNIDGVLYWCDPEAPETAAVPVTITWAELALYVNAFAGKHLVAPILGTVKEDIMNTLTSYLPDSDLVIKAESNIRAAADIQSTKLRTVPVGTSEARRALGTVKGDVDPATGSDVWYVWFANGRFEFTAKDNVTVKARVAPVAVDDGFTKVTQDAAVAAALSVQAGALSAAQAAATAAKAAIPAAVTAERERIALAEATRIRTL